MGTVEIAVGPRDQPEVRTLLAMSDAYMTALYPG